MPKVAPFPILPPRQCDNPDCAKGDRGTRAVFVPKTPWQSCCTPACRNHKAWLKEKSKKDSNQT